MKLVQYIGPFQSGEQLTIPTQTGYSYVQIGIQIPFRQPVSLITDGPLPIDMEINGVGYRINDSCILEFDELNEISINITFMRDLPWETIIDVMYDAQSD